MCMWYSSHTFGAIYTNGYEINTRIIFVMRLLGVSLAGINLFCAMMNIGKGLSKDAYNRIAQHIHEAVKKMKFRWNVLESGKARERRE